ncbi:MAG TPA: hypothetical protein VF199_04840 [Bacillales bacterium]
MSDWMSPNFFINDIHIGTVSEAASVNLGNNTLTDLTSNHKQNQGFGSVGGDKNRFSNAKAILYDPDVVDLQEDPRLKEIPDWLKEMIEEKPRR